MPVNKVAVNEMDLKIINLVPVNDMQMNLDFEVVMKWICIDRLNSRLVPFENWESRLSNGTKVAPIR